jgi:hypothetical protein
MALLKKACLWNTISGVAVSKGEVKLYVKEKGTGGKHRPVAEVEGDVDCFVFFVEI